MVVDVAPSCFRDSMGIRPPMRSADGWISSRIAAYSPGRTCPLRSRSV